ncbi:hypothetical protein [Micromonospora sp. SL4-19]|uniref:hypothetical protein n=1 Tax=Micromonospora sp. SL4-19 TaxID=3399129 RepID=UPI003A4D9C2B
MTSLATAETTPPATVPVARPGLVRFAPALVAYAAVAGILLITSTSVPDLLRYTLYAAFAVLAPGVLVYRALRRHPHTLVEDVAMGAAVGLVLELAGWAVFTGLGVPGWLRLWPLAVLVPFAVLPRLRRHWWVRYDTRVPLGWAWAVTGVVIGFTLYLAQAFLRVNPVIPNREGQRQYMDLAFQMSIAGAAKHQMPPEVPQVAGEPLHYHWFGFAHMAASSLVSGVDLTAVFFRLAVPALCALVIVLVAVVGWRVSGRPYAGAAAAVLMFAIGEFGYENGVRQLFGTQATFIVWGSPSMTYSWVLLLPLIAVVGDIIGRARASTVPVIGRGAWAIAVLLLAASTGAKASSLPVLLAAVLFTAGVLLVVRRRLEWMLLLVAALALGAQLFATAVLFAFESHGVAVSPFSALRVYVRSVEGWSTEQQALLWVGVAVACLLYLQLRMAGVVALLHVRRWRLEPVQLFLLGGALAGPAIFLLVSHPGASNHYFSRTGFAFGVLLSGWGYAELLERAALPARGRALLAASAAGFAVLLTLIQLRFPAPLSSAIHERVYPLLRWAGALVLLALALGVLWRLLARGRPALAGRGGAVLLTGVLVAGAPGLVLDAQVSQQEPNGGAYRGVSMPASKVEAARWVRDHSSPDDVVATNSHCQTVSAAGCDSRTFWVSAYTERSVLVEGWAFAPRMVGQGWTAPFWDSERLRLNDVAFAAPTPAGLAELRDRYGVRWLVADRTVAAESPALADLAELRFRNKRVSVYRLH